MNGHLTAIIGPMFSGKSSAMVSAIERFHRGGKKCIIIKHCADKRFGASTCVITHAGFEHNTVPVVFTGDLNDDTIARIIDCNDVIGVDEIQFFAMFDDANARAVINTIEGWLMRKKTVICAGLDNDWKREPFAILAHLVARANVVVKLLAVCQCGADAPFTIRKLTDSETYANPVGGGEKYAAVCRACFMKAQTIQ